MVAMTAYKESDTPGDIFQNAKNTFINGDLMPSLELFVQAGKHSEYKILSLFYTGWINFILSTDDTGNNSPVFSETTRPDRCEFEEIETELCEYLDKASETYGLNRAFSDIDDIIAPRGMAIVKLFLFAGALSQELLLGYGDIFLKAVDRWIDALTMRLFHQAEFSGIRLKLPVELITKKDIENAKVIFNWLERVCMAIVDINGQLGEKFFELQIAFRLDLVEKCLPKLKDICRTYTYFLPSRLYEAELAVEIAKNYAFVILSMCYSLSFYNIEMRKSFVEAVPLLQELKLVRSESYNSDNENKNNDNPPQEKIYYQLPEEEYRDFTEKAEKLIKKIRAEDETYIPPPGRPEAGAMRSAVP